MMKQSPIQLHFIYSNCTRECFIKKLNNMYFNTTTGFKWIFFCNSCICLQKHHNKIQAYMDSHHIQHDVILIVRTMFPDQKLYYTILFIKTSLVGQPTLLDKMDDNFHPQ